LLDGYSVVLTPSVAPLPVEKLKGKFFYIIYKIYLTYLYFYRYSIILWKKSSITSTDQMT